ncbi:MAG: hypothetical protein IPK26_23480 [Planctomycetes bacterium]|nr:hypothetical protein [Planctomycetota bacterium]
MTRSISQHDERLVHRFLDGELLADAASAFARRLQAEPQLRERHRQLVSLRTAFAADRRQTDRVGMVVPAGFAAGVLAAARQLPADGRWRRDIADDQVMLRWCRRILVAAAVLLCAALAWHSGLFANREAALQASPAEMERAMEQLDQAIRDRAVGK